MNTKKNVLLGLGSAFAALVLVGCGGGDSSTTASTGYLVDSAVANANYDCIADGTFNEITGPDGSFTCTNMSQVRFRVGNLILGEIHTLPSDQNVFPQDLLGVPRESGVNDAKVIAMAQLLQSIDSDGNPENGITIATETRENIVETETSFNPSEVPTYLNTVSAPVRTEAQVREHLTLSVQQAIASANAAANTGVAQSAANTGVTTGVAATDAGVAAGQSAANAGVQAGTDATNAISGALGRL